MRQVSSAAAWALAALAITAAHAEEVHVHVGTFLDYIDVSAYQKVCASIARTPNTRVDKVATMSGMRIPFSFRWQCIDHQLFLNDGGEACMDADNPVRCLGEPAKTNWIKVAASGYSVRRRAPADILPREAIKVYCKAADNSIPAIFGDGRNGLPIEWRCVKGEVFTCEAGADGVACSARSRSRTPLPSMAEACRDYGQLSVADGALSTIWQ